MTTLTTPHVSDLAVAPARPALHPTAPQALALLDALDAAGPVLAPVDAAAWQADVQRKADDLQRTLPRTEQASRADLEARAAARLSEAHATSREASFDAVTATIDTTLSDTGRRLQADAEARRAVALPAIGLTPDEQAAIDKETSALLGPLSQLTAAQLVETRRLNSTHGELVALLTLTDATPTEALLDAMAHGETPHLQRRAERLLHARQGALRVEAATAETPAARDTARHTLQRFEAIREARVSPEARQAEAHERQAWQALAQHAQHVRSRVAVWRQAGIAADQGASADLLARWDAERQALRDMFGGAR